MLVSKSKVSLNVNKYIQCILKNFDSSNWQIGFGNVLYTQGAQHLENLMAKPEQGTPCSTNFHGSWLLPKLIVDDSISSSNSFKYNGALQCIAYWVSRKYLYTILAFIGKMCK